MSWENKSFGEYTHVCHFEEKVFGVVLSTLHNTSLIEERWREGEKNIYDLSTIYRPSIDHLSTNYRRSILVTIDQLSTKCRPTIDPTYVCTYIGYQNVCVAHYGSKWPKTRFTTSLPFFSFALFSHRLASPQQKTPNFVKMALPSWKAAVLCKYRSVEVD